jgi:endonuclease YncB( thermonuclease family)/tRNA A-37 threonylcarbamoyl transferase component Bud32
LGQTLLDAILKAPEATTEVVSGESTILDEFIQFLSEETNKKKEKKKEWDRVSGGYDDQYNTIEGIHPDSTGLGAAEVRAGSDFGSGYRGLPTSLLGVPIDPEVLRFRENVIDDSDEWSALEARLNKKQAASQAQLGQFRGTDLFAPNLAGVEGLAKTTGLKEVRLSDFKITAEDADTILLKRRGLTNLLSPSISVRLSGIDAPETAGHAADPMEEVRIWQSQPGGEEAAERLSQLIDEQGDLRLLIGSDQTYGRSLGVLVGDEGENLSLSLLREGMVAALPFGKKSGDIISREAAAGAEEQARFRDEGIWSLARYKAIHEASEATGQPITFNTFTELTRLSRNLMLGAYGTYLQGFGDEERELTGEEVATSRRLGRALRRRFGPNAFVGQKFPAMPNRGTMAADIREQHTEFKADFASRWDSARKIAVEIFGGEKEAAFKKLITSDMFKKSVSEAYAAGGKQLGSPGAFGTVTGYTGKFAHGGKDYSFGFAVKEFNETTGLAKVSYEVETRALKGLGDRVAPSFYGEGAEFGLSGNSFVMEMFEGKSVEKAVLTKKGRIPGGRRILKGREARELEEEIRIAHERGFTHMDLHLGNIMKVKTGEGKRIAIIDWGLSGRATNPEIDKNIYDFFEPQLSKAYKQAGFKDNLTSKIFEQHTDLAKVESYTSRRMEQSKRRQMRKFYESLAYTYGNTIHHGIPYTQEKVKKITELASSLFSSSKGSKFLKESEIEATTMAREVTEGAEKTLAKISYHNNKSTFVAANNAGKRHSVSAASRSADSSKTVR